MCTYFFSEEEHMYKIFDVNISLEDRYKSTSIQIRFFFFPENINPKSFKYEE